jgi:hypothetical protein
MCGCGDARPSPTAVRIEVRAGGDIGSRSMDSHVPGCLTSKSDLAECFGAVLDVKSLLALSSRSNGWGRDYRTASQRPLLGRSSSDTVALNCLSLNQEKTA